MPKAIPFNLVLELKDTNIPHDPCNRSCSVRHSHYIVVRPKDYNKRTKKLKHGAKMVLFTITAKTRKDLAHAIIEDAKTYQFKNG